jgi:hypothetical protein
MPCCTKPSKTKGATESARRPAVSKISGQPATYANAHPGQQGQPQGSARNLASRPTERTTNTPATGPVTTGPIPPCIAGTGIIATEPRSSDTGSSSEANKFKHSSLVHLRYSSANSPRSGHSLSSGYSPSYGHSHGKDSGATHCGGGSAPDGGC